MKKDSTYIAILGIAFLFLHAAQARAEQVLVHIPTYSEAVMPLVVARDKGFYAQEGIEASLVQARGSIGLKAMIAGEFDFSTAIGSALVAALQGLPVRILMVSDYKPMFWLYARPEIKSVTELKGKTVAISSLGSASDTLLRHVLQKRGLSSRDVVIIAIGAGAERYVALNTGAVEAAVLSAPSNLFADKAGLKMLAAFGEEFETVKGGLAAPKKLLDEHADRVQRFLNATIKGLKYFKGNREGSIPLMTKAMRIDQETARILYDLQIDAFTDNGVRGEDFMRTSIQMQMEQLGKKGIPPTDAVFDFSFAKNADEKLKK